MPPALLFLSFCRQSPVTSIEIGKGQGPCTVSPMWKGHAAKYDFPGCRGNLIQEPRSCSSAYKEGRLHHWSKTQNVGKKPAFPGKSSLRLARGPGFNIDTPAGKRPLGVVGRTVWRECQQGPQGLQLMRILRGHPWWALNTHWTLHIALELVRTSGVKS